MSTLKESHMAAPLSAAKLKAALEKWGVKVAESPGWTSRKRPGSFAPHGVMLHHTGSSDSASSAAEERVLVNGRSDLPGPLCQLSIRDDGTVVLIAVGRSNHAGKGSKSTLDRVIAEDYSGELKPGPDTEDGNTAFYGVEIQYSGSKRPTVAAYAAAVKMCAAICDAYGWSSLSVTSHREWTRRKVDPGKIDMADFRKDVAAALKAGSKPKPAPKPEPKEDEDVASAKEIAEAVWNWDGIYHNVPGATVNTDNPADPGNPKWRPMSVIEETENRLRVLESKVDRILAALEGK
jgi:hypothetical protein